VAAHHDALEFPDGQIVPLTFLYEVSKLPFFSYESHSFRLGELQPLAAFRPFWTLVCRMVYALRNLFHLFTAAVLITFASEDPVAGV
jgi:hypothetical protein